MRIRSDPKDFSGSGGGGGGGVGGLFSFYFLQLIWSAIKIQEGLAGPLRPLKLCPNLFLCYTVNFLSDWYTLKQTQHESCVPQYSTEKINPIYLQNTKFHNTLSAIKFLRAKFWIHCEAHCQKFENWKILISKAVEDIQQKFQRFWVFGDLSYF